MTEDQEIKSTSDEVSESDKVEEKTQGIKVDVGIKVKKEEVVEEVSSDEVDSPEGVTSDSELILDESRTTDSLLVTNGSVGRLATDATAKIRDDFRSGNVSMKEGATQIAHAVITAKALDESDSSNKEFIDTVKEVKQEEIKASFQGEALKAQTEKAKAKNKRAEEFYYSVRPILEFDLSNMIKTKDGKDGDTKPQKTYEDRAYGVPLMVLMLILLLIPFCIVTVILALFNAVSFIFEGINSIFVNISKFSKPAMILTCTILVLVIAASIILLILYGLDSFGVTNIFKKGA